MSPKYLFFLLEITILILKKYIFDKKKMFQSLLDIFKTYVQIPIYLVQLNLSVNKTHSELLSHN